MTCRKLKNQRKAFWRLGVILLAAAGLFPVPASGLPKVTAATGVVAGNNQFAWKLYQTIAAAPENQGQNIFFSPYSLTTALTMTYAGSRGKTAGQMARVLHYSLSQTALHQGLAALRKRLTPPDSNLYQLDCANALWGQRNYHLESSFVKLIKQYYQGGLQTVDYVARPQTAINTINQWVKLQTNSKIKNLLNDDDIDDMTRLILTNAIYFKGNWECQFKPDRTQMQPFAIGTDTTVNAPLMRQKGQFRYGEVDGAQVLELPYSGNNLVMLALLPKGNLGKMEQRLTAARIQDWQRQLVVKEVEVWLPRFKFETRYYLEQLLPKLGMIDAFSKTEADFSGITGKRDLYISRVIHQALIEVNEEGTEAAAASAVTLKLKGVMSIPVFRADHPFSFAIIDQATKTVLFLGRICNPTR
jgi:serpin B